MPISSLKSINQLNEKNGDKIFANTRNAASGSLRQLDPKVTKSRKLSAFFYTVVSDYEYTTQEAALKEMMKSGLPVEQHFEVCDTIDDVIKFCDKWNAARDSGVIDFEIDGVVVKVNNLEDQITLGARTKTPRWAAAYKFPARQITTTIEAVEVNVGRTGAITPVGLLDPVQLGGVTISRVSLHNYQEVRRKELMLGSRILLERSGDVIPYVVKVVDNKSASLAIKAPGKCPVCGGPTSFDGAILYCTNGSCPSKLKRSITHFASKRAMDIDGVGTAFVEELVNRKLLTSYSSLYYLCEDDIRDIPGYGDKSAAKLIESIQESKTRGLDRLINALGIPGVGRTSGQKLAQECGSIQKLMDMTEDRLTRIEGIGNITAKEIRAFFENRKNREAIDMLKEAGVNPKFEKAKGKLTGYVFAFTGELNTMTRDIASEKVESLGASAGGVSKQTTHLVVGANPGSKLEKAKKLGVKILSEDEFLEMV